METWLDKLNVVGDRVGGDNGGSRGCNGAVRVEGGLGSSGGGGGWYTYDGGGGSSGGGGGTQLM